MTVAADVRFVHDSGFVLDARFEAGPGVTAIRGPSGCGKTTLLELVAGLRRVERGWIELDGARVASDRPRLHVPPDRRGIGMVFQDARLFPHRTVRGNLRYGMSRRHPAPIAWDDVVDGLELGSLLDRRPSSLSGGQARRVAVGRAVLRGPRVLLLDEPASGLDPARQDRVANLVRWAVEQHDLRVLVVSHQRGPLDALARRTIELDAGRVVRIVDGPPEDASGHAAPARRRGPAPVG